MLRDHSEIAPAMTPAGRHDRCWLPRSSMVTGGDPEPRDRLGHDPAGEPDLWVVNTRFSCLAGLDRRYSFVPRWRPPFVSRLAPEDRCHLNGLAMRDGSPAFVTVMARRPTSRVAGVSTQRHRYRARRGHREPVTTGLAMPHSPRWHDGQLFVLNSGMGRLERVDPQTGQREVVATFPGYARGLAIHGGLAFVGLSKIRETTTFGGVAASRPTTTSSSAASASSSSAPARPSARSSSPPEWRRSSTSRWSPARVVRRSGARLDDDDDVWVLPHQG